MIHSNWLDAGQERCHVCMPSFQPFRPSLDGPVLRLSSWPSFLTLSFLILLSLQTSRPSSHIFHTHTLFKCLGSGAFELYHNSINKPSSCCGHRGLQQSQAIAVCRLLQSARSLLVTAYQQANSTMCRRLNTWVLMRIKKTC